MAGTVMALELTVPKQACIWEPQPMESEVAFAMSDTKNNCIKRFSVFPSSLATALRRAYSFCYRLCGQASTDLYFNYHLTMNSADETISYGDTQNKTIKIC